MTGAIATACHFAVADLMNEEGQNMLFQWGCPVSCYRDCIPSIPEESIGFYAVQHWQKLKVPVLRNSKIF